MTVQVRGKRIVLEGRCGVAEAEQLLAALLEVPDRTVVIKAEKVHTALWQVLIALKPKVAGEAPSAFVDRFLRPLWSRDAEL